MRPSDFRTIEDYFVAHNLTKKDAQFAFSMFIENVEEAIKDHEEKHGDGPNETQTRDICRAYLRDATLSQYLRLAEVNAETEKQAKAHRRTSWWAAIGQALLANLIFLILVLGTFYVGADQWAWIIEKVADALARVSEASQTSPK